MRRKFIVNLIAVIVVAILTGSSIIFAWYTNTMKSSSVEIDTNGVSIAYKINTDQTVNVEEYDIENISFFDIESPNEAYYLTSMAVCLKFNVVNYSSTAVDVSLMQDTQAYTLGTTVSNGVISVYKYTKASVTKTAFTQNTHFAYDNDTFTYSAPAAYVTGSTYYTRELMFVATPTFENGKIKSVRISDAPTGKTYYSALENDASGIAVEEYVEVTDLTEAEFNSNGARYYTLNNDTYTLAKVYNRASYYEKKTVAYLSDFTIAESKITNVGYAVTGSYVTCAIADSTKLTSKNGTYVLPSVAEANRYTTSVNSYLASKTISHSYTTTTKLSTGALGTAGGSTDIYVFVYGVQPYAGATNNFLNNDNNIYPIKLIIKAE